jgi:uncharacterized protein with GYD domain
MPKFLIQVSMHKEGIRDVLSKAKGTGLRAAVSKFAESAGGKLDAYYFAFGQHDVVAIVDFPDNVSAAAVSVAANGWRRYAGEVGLPKGKVRLAKGETVVGAAEREVREEIVKYARITEFAGLTHYLIKGRPKVVFFYYMKVIANGEGIDAGEIEFVEWLTPAEAFSKLTHAEDRRLIAKAFALGNP